MSLFSLIRRGARLGSSSRRGLHQSVVAANKVHGAEPLAVHDPEMHELLLAETQRQLEGLELIASENFTSHSVMEVLGSCFTNKYSEGLPGARYYGGNVIIDQVENLCRQRALQAFDLDPDEWGVNVQPYSGSPANFAVYTALLEPHDRVMGMNLPSGGHLTHGYYTSMRDGTVKNISATSKYFESLPYNVHPETGLIDFDEMQYLADMFKPKMLICGASAYPRDYDYARFREVADSCGAYLLCDLAHTTGLIAGGVLKSPFEYADVVTSTTHKSLRGPRSGLIFAKKELMDAVDFSVFPSLQGGPHNHQIAGVATQLKEVCAPEWREYCLQVQANAAQLADSLISKGHKFATGGTENHLLLWDLRPHGVTGAKYEMLGDAVGITLNKNTIHGDKSALSPGAVRIGACALTSRGMMEDDFKQVAEFLDQGLGLCKSIQDEHGKKLKDFRPALEGHAGIEALKADVASFASAFPMPGRRYE